MTPWLITAFTVVSVYYLDRLENRRIQSLFDWIPAILLAYLIPAAISALLKEDWPGDAIHQYSKLYFIPLAIVAVMSSLSLSQLRVIGWKPIAVFVVGSFWISIFPVMFAFVLRNTELVSNVLLQQGYWRGVPPIVGSWIGGSTSQLVLKELVACPENIFLTVLVLDNILVNIWTILMFQSIKKSDFLNQKFGITNQTMPAKLEQKSGAVMPAIWCLVLLVGTVLCVNFLLDNFVAKIVVLSFVGLLFSNLIKRWNFSFVLKLGGLLILTVMAILGLKLKFDLLQMNVAFLGFLIIWLLSHFVIMLVAAKLLNVNAAWVPIASMANVGGIATAPAVTAAYEKTWMPHAVILAILSMATGTFWGILTIYLFERLIV